jgi:ubiquinol-cytochrome c reductase cytochrome b subunit
MAGAQPDWYFGWVEGAMRLFPGVNLHLGHWLISEIFFPAILMPSLLFLGLYSWPFVEKLFSSDVGDQNVLRLPYQQPVLTAGGAGLFTFLLILLVAGGDDFLALAIDGSVVEVRTVLRILVLAAPPCAALLAYAICKKLRDHKDALQSKQDTEEPAAQAGDYAPASSVEETMLAHGQDAAFREGV